jgi:hypothetical protein
VQSTGRNQRSRSIAYDRCVAVGRPAACRSRKNTDTASTLTPVWSPRRAGYWPSPPAPPPPPVKLFHIRWSDWLRRHQARARWHPLAHPPAQIRHHVTLSRTSADDYVTNPDCVTWVGVHPAEWLIPQPWVAGAMHPVPVRTVDAPHRRPAIVAAGGAVQVLLQSWGCCRSRRVTCRRPGARPGELSAGSRNGRSCEGANP